MAKTKKAKAASTPAAEKPIVSNSKIPLIFISHDTRDAEIAEAFSTLLSNVSMGVLKSFRSSDKKGTHGIEYGVEWFPVIMQKLDEASDIVCLLTQHSVERPWILYEAGVAKGKLDTTVLGVTLGIPLNTVQNSPFAQFQNCTDEEDALTKLVMQLAKRIPNADPPEDIVREQVKKFKATLDELLKKQPKAKDIETEATKEDASVAKLFEEVKIMFQDLPSRIDKRLDFEGERRRRFRVHPMMFEEIAHIGEFGSKGEGRLVSFLMMISMFKSDFPWLYELGVETYKGLKASKAKADRKKLLKEFQNVLEFTLSHPMAREMFGKSDSYFMHHKEMRHFISHFVDRMMFDDKE